MQEGATHDIIRNMGDTYYYYFYYCRAYLMQKRSVRRQDKTVECISNR